MENIIYNGVDGVFIPNDEFYFIKETVKTNSDLIKQLINDLAKENPNAFKIFSEKISK